MRRTTKSNKKLKTLNWYYDLRVVDKKEKCFMTFIHSIFSFLKPEGDRTDSLCSVFTVKGMQVQHLREIHPAEDDHLLELFQI